MCKVLKIARSTFYYETEISAKKELEKQKEERKLEEKVADAFNKNRQVYGTRKLKSELAKNGIVLSRRRIGRFMKELGLQS